MAQLVNDAGTTVFEGQILNGGSQPLTVLGPVTLTFADFAENWDEGNDEGGALVGELLAGDIPYSYRAIVTAKVRNDGDQGSFVTLGVVDAGPGSWASPFATTPTNAEGDIGPSFISANAAASADVGSLMTDDDTLYLVYGNGSGPPTEGRVTIVVFVLRPV